MEALEVLVDSNATPFLLLMISCNLPSICVRCLAAKLRYNDSPVGQVKVHIRCCHPVSRLQHPQGFSLTVSTWLGLRKLLLGLCCAMLLDCLPVPPLPAILTIVKFLHISNVQGR